MPNLIMPYRWTNDFALLLVHQALATSSFLLLRNIKHSSNNNKFHGLVGALTTVPFTTSSRERAVDDWLSTRRSFKSGFNLQQPLYFCSKDPLNSADCAPSRHYTMSSSSNNNNIDEVERAKAAAAAGIPNDNEDNAPPTIFDKIVAGQIPCNKLYEDDLCLAFHDVNPQAPTHFLVIPKQRQGLTQLSKMKESQKELVGHLVFVAQQLGQAQCPKGFRLVVNDGPDGSQSVYHLHIHVFGGRQMLWPPG